MTAINTSPLADNCTLSKDVLCLLDNDLIVVFVPQSVPCLGDYI